MLTRISKHEYYLKIATIVLERGTCLRRNYGAVIVLNDQIVSTGYTGAPRGMNNCCDLGICKRTEMNVPAGERYELCESVHAEMNAIIHAGRERCLGATMYLVGRDSISGEILSTPPCLLCRRVVANAGIDRVYTYADVLTKENLECPIKNT
jgi:dCMP deaminase